MEKNEPQVTADELLSPRQTEKEPNKQYHPSACASLELEQIERIREDIVGFTDERDLLNAEAVFNLIVQLNQNKKWVKELTGMGAFRDLFQEEFDKKDREIAEQREEILDLSEQLQTQSEQLQTQSEQLQTQSEQLQSEQEKNNRLQKEVEDLKRQLQELAGKIAVL